MRGFKSAGQAQRFLSVHGVIRNLFNLGRHQLSSANYRLLRERSFKEPRLCVTGAGKVGIGTITPGQQLTVAGPTNGSESRLPIDPVLRNGAGRDGSYHGTVARPVAPWDRCNPALIRQFN